MCLCVSYDLVFSKTVRFQAKELSFCCVWQQPNIGGGRSHMRGKGTAETDEASAAENARITIETIRHAAVANLRDPPRGCESLIRAHFKATRNRMLRR